MSKLFESYTIGGLEVRNRIVMPPMCMYSATDGKASDFHTMHYGARALGGVGLIIVEATGVAPCGRISDNCLGAYDDSQTEGLARIAATIKAYGATAAIQLIHAGRKCTAQVPAILAPSAVAFDDNSRVPEAMSIADIDEVVGQFKSAARRAAEAGFEMAEVHGAHGYLLSQFMSPLCNKRTDEYGGSHENRARLLGRVLEAVRQAFPGPVGIRVSAEDYMPEGNRPADVIAMINSVKHYGIDIVDVSSGGVVPVPPPTYAGYQVKFAEMVKEHTGLPVMAGGLLTSPLHCDDVVSNGRAEMVFVGRELLRNPHFPLYAARELGVQLPWPKQYTRATFTK